MIVRYMIGEYGWYIDCYRYWLLLKRYNLLILIEFCLFYRFIDYFYVKWCFEECFVYDFC